MTCSDVVSNHDRCRKPSLHISALQKLFEGFEFERLSLDDSNYRRRSSNVRDQVSIMFPTADPEMQIASALKTWVMERLRCRPFLEHLGEIERTIGYSLMQRRSCQVMTKAERAQKGT